MAALNPRIGDLSDDDRQAAEQFGRYRIIKRLGQGGMGSVYLAQDTHLERPVALKVPDFGNYDDPEARRRFLEEARTAATLDHPYLCPVYDAGEIDGQLYLTMAYVEGQSLAALIGEEGWPQRQVAALVGKLALALQEAHARKVVHRDLKPANVMIKTTGQRREPVIVDFGLARRDNPQEQRLTKSGQVMGTLGYMSPEQIRGDLNEIGPGCDIYALGVILYELLTGRLPFSGSNLGIAGQILTQAPLPPSTHRSDLDPALEAICLKAMSKAVRDRYASMAELATALTGFLQSPSASPTPAASSGSPASPSPTSGERPQPAGSDSLVGNFLAQLAEHQVPAFSSATPEPVALRERLPERRRLRRPMIVAAGVFGVLLLSIIIYVIAEKGRVTTTLDGAAHRSGKNGSTVDRGSTEFETRAIVASPSQNEDPPNEYVPQVEQEKPATLKKVAEPKPVEKEKSANAEIVTDDLDDRQRFDGAHIALQQLSPDTTVGFRKIENKELSGTAQDTSELQAGPARAGVGGQPVRPAALPSKLAGQRSIPPTRLVHANEFNSPHNGLPKDLNIPHVPLQGTSDGVYYIYAKKGITWRNHPIHAIPSDGTFEVVGRVLSEGSRNPAAWQVAVISKSVARGFHIKINMKGELSLEPTHPRIVEALGQIDPRIDPVVRPAIKPGNEFNKLLLVMKKREVVLFVNGVQICDPVIFDYNITPAALYLEVAGGGNRRAEFDRVEIRELVQREDAPEKTMTTPPVSEKAVKAADLPKPQPMVPDEPPEHITNTIGMRLTLIPAGEFLMGSPDSDPTAESDEKPPHRVRISKPFYLGIHEVTQGQYRAVMGESPSHFKGSDDLPVESVSWLDSVKLCNKLSEREKRTPFYRIDGNTVTPVEGEGYRLPTEAEWEYACRAGSTTLHPFGDNAGMLQEHAWYGENSEGKTHPVGRKLPNAWGLHDMLGNVFEWCGDWYDKSYYASSPESDPSGPLSASDRVPRGGGFPAPPRNCRSANRHMRMPEARDHNLGFRVALVQSGH